MLIYSIALKEAFYDQASSFSCLVALFLAACMFYSHYVLYTRNTNVAFLILFFCLFLIYCYILKTSNLKHKHTILNKCNPKHNLFSTSPTPNSPTPNTPNVLFVTNNRDYSFKVGLVTFCGDYPTK